MTQITSNPYVGPRTFTRKERNRFFGREQEARDLISLIISERLVLFYAQSGAGKSSIINTRILPQLIEKEGFVALPVGRVSGEIPKGVSDVDNIFAFNLMVSIDHDSQDPSIYANMTLTRFLGGLTTTDGENFFYDENTAAETATSGADLEQPPHILIIDQFEEIVTTHLNRWQQREAFFRQLNQALQDDPLLWVLLSLREDYVAALRPYQRILYNNMRGRFYMKRMEAEAALQAVEAPAKLGDRSFAPGVAQILVDNLRQIRIQGGEQTQPGQFIEPVQLQVVCYQLWQNLQARPDPLITQKDLEELGDVDTALAQFYEQAISHVLQQKQMSEIELRNWFDTKLITEAGTRGTVYQGSTETASLDNTVVRLLADQFLLRAEIRAGGTWYELVHDRFVEPILKANQTWRLRQSPIIQAAEVWERSNRNRDKLYKGEQLKETLATLDRAAQEPLVQAFLTASEEAQSQRDLEETKAIMEEERRRAEAKARTAQRLRWLSIGLAVMVIFALVASILAVRSSVAANQSRAEAVNNANLAATSAASALDNAYLAATKETEAIAHAELAAISAAEALANADLAGTREAEANASASLAATSEAEAVANEALAVASQAESDRLSRISLAQSLAAVAPRIVDRTNDTELATLLSVEALYVSQEVHNEDHELIDSALRDVLGRPYFNTVLKGHEGWVQSLAFTPNGQILASMDHRGTIILWKLASHSSDFTVIPFEQARGYTPSFNNSIAFSQSVLFSPDGRFLASINQEGVYLWDLQGHVIGTADIPPIAATLTGQNGQTIAIAFSTDGQALTAFTNSNYVVRWDLNQPDQPPVELLGPSRIINDVLLAFSPDGRYLVSANRSTVYIRDLSEPGRGTVQIFGSGLGYDVTYATFNPDGQSLVTADVRNNIAIWDFSDPGTVVNPIRFIPQESSIRALAFSANNQTVASISLEISDLAIHLWDLHRPNFRPSDLAGHNSGVNTMVFSANGRFLASGSDDSQIRLWDLSPSQAAPVKLVPDSEPALTVSYSADGQVLMSINNDLNVNVWDSAHITDTPTVYTLPPGFFASDNEAASQIIDINPTTKTLAAVNPDGNVILWHMENGVLSSATTLPVANQGISNLWFSPDGESLAVLDEAKIAIWGVNERTETAVLTGFEGEITAIIFSPDGQTVAATDLTYTVYMWNLSGSEAPITFDSKHTDWISNLAFSSDGQQFASVSNDLTAHVWQVDQLLTNPEPLILSGHVDWVLSLAFSPNGRTLATASWDRSIRLWDLTINDPAAAPTVLSGHNAQVNWVTFSPDGHTLASASSDQTVRLWHVTMDKFVEIACQQVRRNLTYDEWNRYLENDPYRRTCPNWPVHPSFMEAARQAAQNGDVETAEALLQEVIAADPSLTLDPQAEVRRYRAEGLVLQAQDLAFAGDVEGALATFEEALSLDASLELDPVEETNRLTARGLIEEAIRVLSEGDIETALSNFERAQILAAGEITADQWNQLCWYGSIWGQAIAVLNACHTAVSLDPESGWFRDSRGLAYALTGDFEAAIADFQYFIDWIANEPFWEFERIKREEWVTSLQAGENPFNEAFLESLR